MRRTLGPLLLSLVLASGLLAGCGDDGSGTATDDGSPSASESPSESGSPIGNGTVDFTQVALISQSGAGGRASQRPTVLDDEAAVGAFARQFRTDAVGNRIEQAIAKADVPDDQTVLGAVVAVGCDVPPGVTVHRMGDGLAVTAMKVRKPLPECLVAVTTVALVAVDSDVL
ncbi:hypothetical protein ACT8ZV_03575 [Nocardioides sp. MAHUQ-72]|uniref:hypothetical protein n=1 Tax=unclassified Nocardioides TaxID=2615069 RepID=UPI00362468CB